MRQLFWSSANKFDMFILDIADTALHVGHVHFCHLGLSVLYTNLYTAEFRKQIEVYLRMDINRNIKIQKQEKMFGVIINQSSNAFIVIMAMLDTSVIYKHRQDGSSDMRIIEILRLMYEERKADECYCEIYKKIFLRRDVVLYCVSIDCKYLDFTKSFQYDIIYNE